MLAQWMDRFTELGFAWGTLVCMAAWRALPLLLLVLALKLVLRHRISPAVYALLWTIVLVRFMLPFSIGTPVSLHSSIDRWSERLINSTDEPVPTRLPFDPLNSLFPNVEAVETATWDAQLIDVRPATPRRISWEEIIVTSFFLLVMVPTVVLLLRSLVAHARFALGLKACPLLTDQSLIDLLLRECDALGVGRRPAVREVAALEVPAVFGLMRHTICLPPGMATTLNEQELRWVLRHELAHIRRRDIAVSILGSIASACHWFNPLVWMTTSRLRAAIEAAADRLAVKSLTPQQATAYGHLLVRLAEGSHATSPSPALGLLPFASGKHLKRRVALLTGETKPNNVAVRGLVALLVACFAAAGLSDARESKNLKTPEVSLPFGDQVVTKTEGIEMEPWNFKEDDGDAFAKSYDVASILDTMPSDTIPSELRERGMDRKTQLLRWLPLPTEIAKRLQLDETTLVANLTARQHELLERTLLAWRSGEPRQIVMETRFIQSDLQTASSIDWTGKRIEALVVEGHGPAIAARINESELKRLIESTQSDRRTNIMLAPRVTGFAAQTLTVASGAQRPFVTGMDAKKDGIAQPVISLIDEGLKFILTPDIRADGGVKLSFEVKATSIGKVSYAYLPIRVPGDSQSRFTVQVPATESYSLRSAVDLESNESVVVAIPRVFNLEPGADTDTTVLVTFTPRVIEPE